jgi:hypothetical protein
MLVVAAGGFAPRTLSFCPAQPQQNRRWSEAEHFVSTNCPGSLLGVGFANVVRPSIHAKEPGQTLGLLAAARPRPDQGGKLKAFALGQKLVRIRAEVVARFEAVGKTDNVVKLRAVRDDE